MSTLNGQTITETNGNQSTALAEVRGHHEVQDSFEAAAYVAKGQRPVGLVGYGTRKRWVFKDLPEALVEAYERDTLLVSAQRMRAAYKRLMHQLHNP
jgi:hypothetical protein